MAEEVGMLEWIEQLMNELGYVAVVLLLCLENIVPPIPSELILPLAGFMTVRGELSFIGVVAAGTLGSVLGALSFYYLGRCLGEKRLKAWADRYGKWIGLSGKDIDWAMARFERHGHQAVLLCRLLPGIRSYISIPAGIARMNLLTFLLYTALGTGLWTTLLAYLGRWLGHNYDQVGRYMGPASYVILVSLLLAGLIWLWWRQKQAAPETERE